MDPPSPFQFGIELELLLGSRKKIFSTWTSLAHDVSKRLSAAGIPNHINTTNDKSPANYLEWSIIQEVTIPHQPAKNLWGIELVSPPYPIHTPWPPTLHTLFTTLHTHYTLHPSPHTSTHIHISSLPSPMSSQALAALAKTALYYEPALDTLVPPSRRGAGGSTYWCQSPRSNPALHHLPLASCLALLDAASHSARAVVEVMNVFPASSAYGRVKRKKRDFVRGKVYKWDLEGMGGAGGRGTVEFRQAGGCVEGWEAVGWVRLVVAFVAGAGVVGGELGGEVEGEGATGEELWGLLVGGGEVVGWEGLGEVEGLFARAG
ncbi:putative amidoligase enzyme-domain-containing protein [Podospora conica]|nr:putative amidoligase enzyme-domain-containing protein [Schizothecium conicum]